MKFLLTYNHMGLDISNRYSSYSFFSIIAKLYDEYGSHRGYKVMDILADRQNIHNFIYPCDCRIHHKV